jgi:hypothetical protein
MTPLRLNEALAVIETVRKKVGLEGYIEGCGADVDATNANKVCIIYLFNPHLCYIAIYAIYSIYVFNPLLCYICI